MTGRISEKTALATWGLRTLTRHGWPRAVTHFAAGVGDELMLTAVMRELRRRGHPRFWVMSQRPELYQHNADISSVLPVDLRVLALARRCGAHVVEPRYSVHNPDGNLRPPPAHMITCLMATSGIEGTFSFRPVLDLTTSEKAAAAPWADSVIVQPTVRSALRPNDLKEWWFDRWQTVVDALGSAHRVVQVGGATEPLLRGVEDLRGHHAGLRPLAAILSQARLFVGLESGLMHLARAVDCPSIILFGGRVHPAQAGYEGFTNIARPLACSPCWRYNGCAFDRQCMRDITPGDVISAIFTTLSQPKVTLPPQSGHLTSDERHRIVAALAA